MFFFFLVGWFILCLVLNSLWPSLASYIFKKGFFLFFYLCIGVFYVCVCLVPVEANRGCRIPREEGDREGCEDSELGAEP